MLHRIKQNGICMEIYMFLMETISSTDLDKIIFVLKVRTHLTKISFQLWHNINAFGKI